MSGSRKVYYFYEWLRLALFPDLHGITLHIFGYAFSRRSCKFSSNSFQGNQCVRSAESENGCSVFLKRVRYRLCTSLNHILVVVAPQESASCLSNRESILCSEKQSQPGTCTTLMPQRNLVGEFRAGPARGVSAEAPAKSQLAMCAGHCILKAIPQISACSAADTDCNSREISGDGLGPGAGTRILVPTFFSQAWKTPCAVVKHDQCSLQQAYSEVFSTPMPKASSSCTDQRHA